jgi:hypothetical protein
MGDAKRRKISGIYPKYTKSSRIICGLDRPNVRSRSIEVVDIEQSYLNLGIEINKRDLRKSLKVLSENLNIIWHIFSDGEDLDYVGTLSEVLQVAEIWEEQIEETKKICLSQGIVWIFSNQSTLSKPFIESDPVDCAKREDRMSCNFLTVRCIVRNSY